jgi:transcriptional regulator NrdR family protein
MGFKAALTCPLWHADALKSLLQTVSEDLGNEMANILQSKSTAETTLDEVDLDERVALLRRALSHKQVT